MKDIQKPVWFEMEYFTSLFQALRQWGRRESERHAKNCRGGKKKKELSFLPFHFRVRALHLKLADPTISEPGNGYTYS